MILVSRLLAAIFVLSAATEIFSPYVSSCKALSESHWASFFHQASLGTHLNLKLFSSLSGKQKVQDPIDVEIGILRSLSVFPLIEDKSFAKCWHCPCGSNVVDDLAPEFKRILEENFSSSSMHHLEDTKDNRSLWWTQRNSLDQRLSTFLSNLEDFWFGPWKFLLLGEFSGCKQEEAALRKLVHNLKVKCNVDAQEGFLKVILGGAKHVCGSEECILQLILVKACFIGYGNQERLGASSDTCHEVESVSKSAFKLTLEALHEVDKGDFLNREPVILVIDFDVQMLPWESLRIVRNQEVYRMPSLGSIFATLDRCCQFQEHDARNAGIFPLIDPLDAFYLLNSSGDLSSRQDKFEDFFRERNLEGKAGTAPTIEELAVALRSHDLYIYFGHGSGLQFIPEQEIQKLQNCAVTLLMGCSSGSLSLNGSYTPQGAPLCYLLADSPVIVANLWEVTDKDID